MHAHNYPLFVVAVFVAVLTTFYMFRLFFVAFVGEPKTHEAGHAHESPGVMVWPLRILAVMSIVGGLIGVSELLVQYGLDSKQLAFTPFSFGTWDRPHVPSGIVGSLIGPFIESPVAALMGIGATLIGFLAARALYGKAKSDPLPAKLGALSRAMANRFYFDELYEATVIRAHDFIAAISDWIDRWIVEGFCIGLVRGGTDLTGRALRLVQTGNLQTYAFLFVLGVAVVLWFVLGK